MRNRNIFLVLLGIFTLICLYHFYFTVERVSLDSKLGSMDTQERSEWLEDPDNAENYKLAGENALSLGLDLQGGMFVTLQVRVDDILVSLAGPNRDSTFNQALQLAQEWQATRQDNFVELFADALQQVDPEASMAVYFGGPALGMNFQASDDDFVDRLKEETEDALDRTFEIIRNRIEQFGVASPNLQKQEGSNRILVELPGVKDTRRVRDLLKTTAKLEFWPTYTFNDAIPVLLEMNTKIKELNELAEGKQAARDTSGQLPADTLEADPQTPDNTSTDVVQEAQDEDLPELPSLPNQGGPGLPNQTEMADADTGAEAEGGDPYAGLSEEEIQEKRKKENPLFAVLQAPDYDRQMANTSPVVGYSKPSDTGLVNEYMSRPEVQSLIPADMKFLWTQKTENDEGQYITLLAIKTNRSNEAPLEGDVIVETSVDLDENNQRVVSMTMDAEGRKKWRKMTSDNKGKSIAVVLDNHVYTYPTVTQVIPSGRSQISGDFSPEEAQDLANILKSGKLPAQIRVEGEEIVGPTLGAETIRAGFISFLLGLGSVIIFMYLYYRKAGLLANVALLLNLFFLISICSAQNVVLTLPGIAGIVLSMGMAVDANVLIYERIREELENGRSLKGAISEGFRNAFSAIIDGNLTTLLTGIILYSFGTGPVRGFAVTLIIGIITTLISALFITRMLLDYQANRENPTIGFGDTRLSNYFRQANLALMKKRKLAYGIVGVLVVGSLALILTVGFKLGVDFTGGRQYVVEFNQPVEAPEARQALTTAFNDTIPVVKTIGGENQLMITTSFRYGSREENVDTEVMQRLMQGLTTAYPNSEPEVLKSTKVGPTVAKDIKEGAIKAVIFALIGMFLYILLRFRGWQFGLGAVSSLVFNVVTVMGVFVILGALPGVPFSVEIDQAYIAALLTIVGYTINDTVVVFDRIRETLQFDKLRSNREDVFNRSVNITLARTTITSVTTLLTVLIMFIFGGETLRGFLLALFLGIIVGTISTIFLASPLSLDMGAGTALANASESSKTSGAKAAPAGA